MTTCGKFGNKKLLKALHPYIEGTSNSPEANHLLMTNNICEILPAEKAHLFHHLVGIIPLQTHVAIQSSVMHPYAQDSRTQTRTNIGNLLPRRNTHIDHLLLGSMG